MENRRIAVVTGASAGVGHASARELARRGFDVGLLARGGAGLEGTASDVEAEGGRALMIPTDVAEYEAVDQAASMVEKELGPIDVWVNNAMTTCFSPLANTKSDDFRRAVEVTFFGQVWGTMAALDRMRPRDRSNIVNVGSALALYWHSTPVALLFGEICLSRVFRICSCRALARQQPRSPVHGAPAGREYLSVQLVPDDDGPSSSAGATDLSPETAAKYIVRAALDGRRSKIIGSWNKMLVAVGQIAPGVGNHYAALGAWESQLSDMALGSNRPDNLRHPADEASDAGSHGIFDKQAGGFLDPNFLKTLPRAGRTFLGAVIANAHDYLRHAK